MRLASVRLHAVPLEIPWDSEQFNMADEFAAQKQVFSFNKFNLLVADSMEWVPVVLGALSVVGCCHFCRRTTMLQWMI